MRSRALEVIGGIAVALVLVGIASSYFLVKILMMVLPGFKDSVYREASKGPYDMYSLIFLTILTLLVVLAVYILLWSAKFLLKRTGFSKTVLAFCPWFKQHSLFNILAVSATLRAIYDNNLELCDIFYCFWSLALL